MLILCYPQRLKTNKQTKNIKYPWISNANFSMIKLCENYEFYLV